MVESEADEMQEEESYVGDANGDFLGSRFGQGESALNCEIHDVIRTRWVKHKQRIRTFSTRPLPVGGDGGEIRNNTLEESASFFASTPPLRCSGVLDFGSHDPEGISKQSSVEAHFCRGEKRTFMQ